jgi:S-(hydroxymethyl)glutathione dehydrogenase / alcohol dehydrogenase
MMMQFKGAVLEQVGQPLQIQTIELPELQAEDVLVRVQASGLCHTDWEVITGSLAYPLPIVLGHEGAGIVEAVGSAVSRVKVGDPVVCSWNPYCANCFYCAQDQRILCEPFLRHQPAGRQLDGGIRYRRVGLPVHHFSVVSSHAQYCVVPQSGAVVVPAQMPLDRACLIGCGVMTGVGAVRRVAKVKPGQSVAVVGCGAVGLNAIQGARLAGAASILAVDTNPAKLQVASAFGATHVHLASEEDLLQTSRDFTQGRGPDVVIECAGGEAALRSSLEMVRPGGQVVILGKVNVNQQVSLRFGSLMGEKRIIRSSYGGARPEQDFVELAHQYLDGQLMLDELITERLPLAHINQGFEAIAKGTTIRTLVDPWA